MTEFVSILERLRPGYKVGGVITTPKRGLVDEPGGYAGEITTGGQLVKSNKPSFFGLPLLINKRYLGKRKTFLRILENNGVENRPIISGNLLKQPFLKEYKLNIKKPNIDIIDKGFYIGNNQFLTNKQFEDVNGIG